MTKYQEEIDDAREMIQEFGAPFAVRRKAEPGSVNIYSESDFGQLTLLDDTLTFASGDVSAVVSAGDRIFLREVAQFANRGPFTVLSVSTLGIVIDGSLTADTEAEWFMDVQSNADTDTTEAGVLLPPGSATKNSFDFDFRAGTLQLSRAKDFILAAKDLAFDPGPGDLVQFGSETFDEDQPAWTVFGCTPIAPDDEPIIWMGIITKD